MIAQKLTENPFLWSCLWQSTAFIGLGLAASLALRRRPCRAHHILLLTIIAAVLAPLATASVKHLGLGLFVAEPAIINPPAEPAANRLPVDNAPVLTGGAASNLADTDNARSKLIRPPVREYPASALAGSDEYPAPVAARSQGSEFPWRKVLLWSWAVAGGILFLRLSFIFATGLHLLISAEPVSRQNVSRALRRAQAKLSITHQVRLYTNRKVRSPIIWCFGTGPILLVPTDAGRDNDSIDWVSVFCHELAHYKRRDHIVGLFAELAVCALPWQLLLRPAKKRLLRLSERACDDWVLACGRPGADYAESLLDLVPQRQMAFVPAVLRSKNGLAARVRRILKDRCSNPRAGLFWLLAVGLTTACIGLGVALAQSRPAKKSPLDTYRLKVKEMHEAAAAGDIRKVKSLLKAGVDVNAQGKLKFTPSAAAVETGQRGYTSLHFAALNGHAKLAEFLISRGADLEPKNNYGRTPLALAVCGGHKEMVQLLLAAGADFNTKDIWYKKLLHHAAFYGHSDLADFLISKGAKIESTSNLGYTPLYLASLEGHAQMVELLIAKGADVNTTRGQMKKTPLYLAAERGHYEVAKTLIAAGANVEIEDMSKRTPLAVAVTSWRKDIAELLIANGASVDFPALHFACFMGDLDKVKKLIEQGARIDQQDRKGLEPLVYAALGGNKDIMRYLKEKGVDINARHGERDYILNKVARYGDKDMAQLLISMGADPKVTAGTGASAITPLDNAILSGNRDVAEVLLKHGAEVNKLGYCRYAPLHRACQKERMDLVELLLAYDADVNVRTGIEQTPLFFAAGADHVEIAGRLIAKGADVNARDKNLSTPLHRAAGGRGAKVAKILIDKGAEVNAKDSRGQTPLHEAAGYGNNEAVELLLKAGAKVDVKSDTGATTLYLAASGSKDSIESVEMLLAAGADINVKRIAEPDEGFSLLHIASRNGNIQVVEFLVAKGLDINAQTAEGRTPLSLAKEQKRNEAVIKLLQEHGAK